MLHSVIVRHEASGSKIGVYGPGLLCTACRIVAVSQRSFVLGRPTKLGLAHTA